MNNYWKDNFLSCCHTWANKTEALDLDLICVRTIGEGGRGATMKYPASEIHQMLELTEVYRYPGFDCLTLCHTCSQTEACCSVQTTRIFWDLYVNPQCYAEDSFEDISILVNYFSAPPTIGHGISIQKLHTQSNKLKIRVFYVLYRNITIQPHS